MTIFQFKILDLKKITEHLLTISQIGIWELEMRLFSFNNLRSIICLTPKKLSRFTT